MAAETLTATRAAATFPVFQASGAGIMCCAYGTYEVAANVEDGDIFEMCRIPAGATIVGGAMYCDDLDTGIEALDMDIGWAANGGSGTYDSADPDGLGNLGVLTGDAFAAGNVSPVAGLIYPFSGAFANGDLPTFTAETTIQVEANAAAGTFTAGALSIVVYYVNS
jgi:hypothetical protein